MSYRKEGLKALSGPQRGPPQMPFYTEKSSVCAWNIVRAPQMVTGIIITVSNRQDLQPMGICGPAQPWVGPWRWSPWSTGVGGVSPDRGSKVMRGK